MSEKREAGTASGTVDFQGEDFQFVLRGLLAAYQPVLEQQLHLIRHPHELAQQVRRGRQTCAEEFAEALALFEKFLTEEVVQRLLPP